MLTHERLRALLDYDAETGVFRWRVNRSRIAKAGTVAGSACAVVLDGGGGYTYIGIDSKTYSAHRLAWFYVYGAWPREQLDHVNMRRTDNRIVNLREATPSQNGANRQKQSRNTTGFKGVCFRKRYGTFDVHVKTRYIGTYATAELAHAAYCEAARKEFGEFARV